MTVLSEDDIKRVISATVSELHEAQAVRFTKPSTLQGWLYVVGILAGFVAFIYTSIIFLNDVKELFDQVDDKYAVMCVKHDYTPKEGTKMDGQKQTIYPRKNWSSVMLFNCGHPSNARLTQDMVNDPEINGAYLHRFSWLKDEEVGELEHTWNYLVGVYDDIEKPNLIHYTEGGPWFENYRNCEFAQEWKDNLYQMMDR